MAGAPWTSRDVDASLVVSPDMDARWCETFKRAARERGPALGDFTLQALASDARSPDEAAYVAAMDDAVEGRPPPSVTRAALMARAAAARHDRAIQAAKWEHMASPGSRVPPLLHEHALRWGADAVRARVPDTPVPTYGGYGASRPPGDGGQAGDDDSYSGGYVSEGPSGRQVYIPRPQGPHGSYTASYPSSYPQGGMYPLDATWNDRPPRTRPPVSAYPNYRRVPLLARDLQPGSLAGAIDSRPYAPPLIRGGHDDPGADDASTPRDEGYARHPVSSGSGYGGYGHATEVEVPYDDDETGTQRAGYSVRMAPPYPRDDVLVYASPSPVARARVHGGDITVQASPY